MAPKSGRQTLLAVVILGLFAPILILLHETGHYLMACSLGHRARFSYNEVIFFFGRLDPHERFLFILAGPSVEALFACIGIAGLLRCRRSVPGLASIRFWILTAFSLGALRWLRVTLEPQPASDESHLSVMMGAPPFLLPVILLVPALAAAVTMLQIHRRNRSLLPFGAGFIAAFVTWILWMTVVGPALFPKAGPG